MIPNNSEQKKNENVSVYCIFERCFFFHVQYMCEYPEIHSSSSSLDSLCCCSCRLLVDELLLFVVVERLVSHRRWNILTTDVSCQHWQYRLHKFTQSKRRKMPIINAIPATYIEFTVVPVWTVEDDVEKYKSDDNDERIREIILVLFSVIWSYFCISYIPREFPSE